MNIRLVIIQLFALILPLAQACQPDLIMYRGESSLTSSEWRAVCTKVDEFYANIDKRPRKESLLQAIPPDDEIRCGGARFAVGRPTPN